MQPADITLLAFTLCNSVRVFAYLPQLWKAATDEGGAKAVSTLTWGMFLVSHVATAAYALVNRADLWMAAMFLANAGACAAILGVAAWKRAGNGAPGRIGSRARSHETRNAASGTFLAAVLS
jgi:hypothetical protein